MPGLLRAARSPRSLAVALAIWAAAGCRSVGPVDDGGEVKVLGGTESRKFPQVGLILQQGGPFCTGSLIAPRTVVTAAHCLVDATPDSLQFVIEDETTGMRTALAVKSATPHPLYDRTASNYDIGRIELASDAPYPPLAVARTLSAPQLLGTRLTAVGYGRNVAPGEASQAAAGSGTKRSAALTVTSVNATKVRVEEADKSACNGDSGGALLAVDAQGKATLAAVISCGDPTCKSFGVGTRADAFASFLGLAAEGGRDAEVTAACGAPFNRSHCEQNSVRYCSNDCYEATLKTEACAASARCRQDPVIGQAHCYDPARWQTVTFTFKKLVIRNGVYAAGPDLRDLYLFVDRDDTRPRLDEPHLTLSSDGKVDIDLSFGRHRLIALQLQGSNATAYTPPIPVDVEPGVTHQTLVLPMEAVRIEVTSEVGWGQAVYITGQGHLLGDWREAERLAYDRQRRVWVYEGVLARDLEFKLVKAPWSDSPRLRLDGGPVNWETMRGNHKVGEGGLPFTGYFRHTIAARF